MKRRTLLGAIGTTGLAALAGCLDDGGGDGTPTDTGTATETPTPMPTPAPSLTGSGFEVDSIEGGTETDSATVSADGTDVVVEGTIWGENGCQTAELGSANYNDGTLTVAVETAEDSEAGDACTTATVEIDYTATVEFENGTPETVVVTHDRGDGPESVVTTSP
ncbi:hypothetical protein [Haloarcula rara]|uniref:hypothetical protein n=1 Tax=Haloarcula rara TaxID=3033387 RepID=UPI0023E8B974|nr:hypothetical protein [Halomicroarcula sp. SHR3]